MEFLRECTKKRYFKTKTRLKLWNSSSEIIGLLCWGSCSGKEWTWGEYEWCPGPPSSLCFSSAAPGELRGGSGQCRQWKKALQLVFSDPSRAEGAIYISLSLCVSKDFIQNSAGKVKWEELASLVFDIMCNDPSCMSCGKPWLTGAVEKGNEEQLLFRHVLQLH